MINGGMFDFEPEGDLKVTGHGAGGVQSSVCNLGPGVVTGCVLTEGQWQDVRGCALISFP